MLHLKTKTERLDDDRPAELLIPPCHLPVYRYFILRRRKGILTMSSTQTPDVYTRITDKIIAVRIPVQSCHQFQTNAATHSISKLPLIPVNTATPKW